MSFVALDAVIIILSFYSLFYLHIFIYVFIHRFYCCIFLINFDRNFSTRILLAMRQKLRVLRARITCVFRVDWNIAQVVSIYAGRGDVDRRKFSIALTDEHRRRPVETVKWWIIVTPISVFDVISPIWLSCNWRVRYRSAT